MRSISIIIVHYKVKELLLQCLQSIRESKPKTSYEIIIVDNDEEKTIEKDVKKRFPEVRYIKSEKNVGFGAGNNIGANAAKGEYLFFLNPDTKVHKNAIDALVAFLEKDEKAGIVAPLLLDKNDKPYPIQGSMELNPKTAFFSLSFINKYFPKNSVTEKYHLKSWNKKDTIAVDAVPGTAFVIRTKIFKKINGFDENFFLYFEENDLCRRVQKLGYKLYMIPEAQINHAWGESTKQRKDVNKFFLESRYYYFKKHFGIIPASLVTAFLSFSWSDLLVIGFIILGAFLRFYRINDTFVFSGEVGHNLLAIKNAFTHHEIPLLGPPTSHPWLYFGPLFYWIYGPVLYMYHFNPLSYVYFGAAAATLLLLINYISVKYLANTRIALFSTILLSFSPLFLGFSRGSRFFALVPLLVYPFIICLYKILKGEKKYYFWLAFLFGSMLSFHFTPLMLVPFVITLLLIKKISVSKKDIGLLLGGFFVPMLPFFIYDVQHRLSMTKNIVLWIPYRILGFVGLYPKNTVTAKVLQENVISFYDFVSNGFLPWQNTYISFGIIIVLAVLIYWSIRRGYKNEKAKLFLQVLLIWLGWGYIALFVHGSPPIHYFVPLLPIPILLFAYCLDKIWSIPKARFLVVCIFLGLFAIDSLYYFSGNWFYLNNDHMTYKPYYNPYPVQQAVAQSIVADAHGQKYILQRIGIDDQFEGDYAQNYHYLLWLYGNEPVTKAPISYTIVEQPFKKNAGKNGKSFMVSNIKIIKTYK